MDVVRFCLDIELFEVLFEWDDIATVKVIKSENNFILLLSYGHLFDAIYDQFQAICGSMNLLLFVNLLKYYVLLSSR